MFNDYQLDLLARLYARILAWPEPAEDEKADCSAGSEQQSAGCGGGTATVILQQNNAGREETIRKTKPN